MIDLSCVPYYDFNKSKIYKDNNILFIKVDELESCIVNNLTVYILSLINNKRTIREIINKLCIDYPDVPADKIKDDLISVFFTLWQKEILRFDNNPFAYKYTKKINDFRIKYFNINDISELYKGYLQNHILSNSILFVEDRFQNKNSIKMGMKYGVDHFFGLYEKDIVFLINFIPFVDETSFEINSYYYNADKRLEKDILLEFIKNCLYMHNEIYNKEVNKLYIKILKSDQNKIDFTQNYLEMDYLGTQKDEYYKDNKFLDVLCYGKKINLN